MALSVSTRDLIPSQFVLPLTVSLRIMALSTAVFGLASLFLVAKGFSGGLMVPLTLVFLSTAVGLFPLAREVIDVDLPEKLLEYRAFARSLYDFSFRMMNIERDRNIVKTDLLEQLVEKFGLERLFRYQIIAPSVFSQMSIFEAEHGDIEKVAILYAKALVKAREFSSAYTLPDQHQQLLRERIINCFLDEPSGRFPFPSFSERCIQLLFSPQKVALITPLFQQVQAFKELFTTENLPYIQAYTKSIEEHTKRYNEQKKAVIERYRGHEIHTRLEHIENECMKKTALLDRRIESLIPFEIREEFRIAKEAYDNQSEHDGFISEQFTRSRQEFLREFRQLREKKRDQYLRIESEYQRKFRQASEARIRLRAKLDNELRRAEADYRQAISFMDEQYDRLAYRKRSSFQEEERGNSDHIRNLFLQIRTAITS